MTEFQDCRAPFDYRSMAREAARERDALKKLLCARKKAGPSGFESEQVWIRENRILYSMYLEQRANERDFSCRAEWREKGGTA